MAQPAPKFRRRAVLHGGPLDGRIVAVLDVEVLLILIENSTTQYARYEPDNDGEYQYINIEE